MKYARALFIGSAIVAALSPTALASQRHHAQARDFFARAIDEADVTPTLAAHKETHGSDCFRSLTPVEVTRGIRHWTGNC